MGAYVDAYLGAKERNLGRQIMNFSKRMEMAVVKIYFRMREINRMKCKRGQKTHEGSTFCVDITI